jgi:dihydroxy-acid dehydratase
VAPEAAVGGPVAFVREGDLIDVDLAGRKIDLLVPQEEMGLRKKAWKPPRRPLTGVLARYAKTVEQANLGAIQR